MPTTVWPWNKKRYTCSAFPSFEQAQLKKYGFVPDRLITDDLRFERAFGKEWQRYNFGAMGAGFQSSGVGVAFGPLARRA
jgi:hypothetical protein